MATLDDVQWEEIELVDDLGLVTTDPSRAFHARPLRPVPRRSWLLRASMMPEAEASSLRAVFESSRAGLTTLTPPGESAVSVEFAEDELRVVRADAAAYEAEVLVREAL